MARSRGREPSLVLISGSPPMAPKAGVRKNNRSVAVVQRRGCIVVIRPRDEGFGRDGGDSRRGERSPGPYMQAMRFRRRACSRCKRGGGRDHQNDLLHRYVLTFRILHALTQLSRRIAGLAIRLERLRIAAGLLCARNHALPARDEPTRHGGRADRNAKTAGHAANTPQSTWQATWQALGPPRSMRCGQLDVGLPCERACIGA